MRSKIERVATDDERVLREQTPQSLGRHVTGHKFKSSSRHGKYLFVRVDDDGWLIMHFGMTGYLEHIDSEKDAPRHTRIQFIFEDGDSLCYVCQRMLGFVGWTNDKGSFLSDEDLGPDAMAEDLTQEKFVEKISGHRGMLRTTLMDQSTIAGIGNVWADEIMFQSRLHPKVKIGDLDREAIEKVYKKMRSVLERGLKSANSGRSVPKSYLLEHRKGDGVCPECGKSLKSIKVSGRTSHYCPQCQPANS